MTKRVAMVVAAGVLLVLLVRWRCAPTLESTPIVPAATSVVAGSSVVPLAVSNADERAAAAHDVRALRATLGNFLLFVKEPHRPPLGDNIDITRALTGGNRLHKVYIATDDPAVNAGRLVDRWGTPYWFHPRSADAIDVVSAGPDRRLFTADDVQAPER